MPEKALSHADFVACEKRVGPNARAVLHALRDLGEPATVKEVLQRVIDRDEWDRSSARPGAPTPAGRAEPYPSIVYAHLRNFVGRGLVRPAGLGAASGGARPKLYAAVAVPGSPDHDQQPLEAPARKIRARAQEAIDLRAAGTPDERSFKEVAEAMGISVSYAHELVADPYGEKARERKHEVECATPGCTRTARDGNRRCGGCRRKIEDLMPSCRVERWARAVARERRITINFMLTEDLVRIVEVETARGTIERRLKKSDSWADGLGACGIDIA